MRAYPARPAISCPRGFTATTVPGNDSRLCISTLPALPGVADAPTTATTRGSKSEESERAPRATTAIAAATRLRRARREPRPDRRSSAGGARTGPASAPSSCRPSGRPAGARPAEAEARHRALRPRCGSARPGRSRARSSEHVGRSRARRSRGRGTRARPATPRPGAARRRSHGAGVTPATAHSSTSGPNSPLVALARSASSSVTAQIVNSPRVLDVAQRVLVDARTAARPDADRRERREREGVEERERREVPAAVRADGRDPGDRARRDEAVHQPVEDLPVQLGGVEDHDGPTKVVVSVPRPSSETSTTSPGFR